MNKRIFISISIGFIFLLIVCSCSTPSPTEQTIQTSTIFHTTTPTPTPTPTSIYPPTYQIVGTQIPVVISNSKKGEGEYLYQDVTITLTLDVSNYAAYSYVNLDDLENSDIDNSDMVYTVKNSKKIIASLDPMNSATLYSLGDSAADFLSCQSHLNDFTNNTAFLLFDGTPICFFTNESRIAIVRYVLGSINFDDSKQIETISFLVTVYNSKVAY